MQGISAWVYATRPKTLAAAAAPVIIGVALAYKNGELDIIASAIALFCAFLIQIGTNFANDYYDHKKGADTHERLGFKRAVASGWISPKAMLHATYVVMTLAFLCGLFLVYKAGWPILLLGLASIISGIAYTGGPFPLGYNGLGDLFVMLFFGQAAVMGTVYVNQLSWTLEAFVWSFGPGALAVNILVLNNLRDIETDIKAGKRTLGVLLGPRALEVEYIVMVLIAAAIPFYAAYTGGNTLLYTAAAIPLAFGNSLFRRIRSTTDRRNLNPLLEKTAILLALYGVVCSSALVLG
jgi:1,4-dihydroxy-2-naphthoate octaprenyltransferase